MATQVNGIKYRDKDYNRYYKGSTKEYYVQDTALSPLTIMMKSISSKNYTVTIKYVVNGTFDDPPRLIYSTNGTTYSSWDPDTEISQTITKGTSTNKYFYIRGAKPQKIATDTKNYLNIIITDNSTLAANISLYGNLGSLVDPTCRMRNCSANYQFTGLFGGSTAYFKVNGLYLPNVNGYTGCYQNLFRNCFYITPSSLTLRGTGPAAYAAMFYHCTTLRFAISLPQTTGIIPNTMYANMYNGCSSLTDVSNIDFSGGVTLGGASMLQMFYGCTSLTAAPPLLINDINGTSACANMYTGCKKLTSHNVTLADDCTTKAGCFKEMFYNCSNLTTAPTLTPKVVAENAYESMFSDCTALNNIKCLATDISANNATTNWTNGVASSGTFTRPAASADIWESGVNGIPSDWTVEDA